MKNSKEKGVTLVEVVVSMAIFSIISAAIFFTVNFASNSQGKNYRLSFFEEEINCVQLCLLSSAEAAPLEAGSDALRAVKLLVGDETFFDADQSSGTLKVYYDENYNYTDSIEAKFTLTVTYNAGEIAKVEVRRISDNELLCSEGGSE